MNDKVFLDASDLKGKLVDELARSPLMSGGYVAELLHPAELNVAVTAQLGVMLRQIKMMQDEAQRLTDLKQSLAGIMEAAQANVDRATTLIDDAIAHPAINHLGDFLQTLSRHGYVIMPSRPGKARDEAIFEVGCVTGIDTDDLRKAYDILIEEVSLTSFSDILN